MSLMTGTALSTRPGGLLRLIIGGMSEGLQVWRQRRIDRAAFRTLLGLDDAMLRDIGVNRADAALEAARIDIPAARVSHENRGAR